MPKGKIIKVQLRLNCLMCIVKVGYEGKKTGGR